MQYQQCAVQQSLTGSRDIGKAIYRFVERSVCVDIVSEFYALFFEIVDNAFVRKVFCPVESHVFQKVSESVLFVLFKDCTHILCNMKLCTLFWLFVVTNVVGKSVF